MSILLKHNLAKKLLYSVDKLFCHVSHPTLFLKSSKMRLSHTIAGFTLQVLMPSSNLFPVSSSFDWLTSFLKS